MIKKSGIANNLTELTKLPELPEFPSGLKDENLLKPWSEAMEDWWVDTREILVRAQEELEAKLTPPTE